MLIDSHCHVPHRKYGLTPKEVVDDAKKEDIVKLISIGTSLKEIDLVARVASQFDNVHSTAGIHPQEDRGIPLEKLEKEFRKVISKYDEIVGIGECGIDVSDWKNTRKLEDQIKLFEMQINIAKEVSLPLVVHSRNGDEHVLELLKKHSGMELRGVIHCFDSDWGFAQKVLDLGFYISFSGMITYPNKDALLEVVKNVPMDRFLVETDAPYLPPQEFRGQVNYPKYVRIVAEKVASVKEIDISEVEENAYRNTCSLFEL